VAANLVYYVKEYWDETAKGRQMMAPEIYFLLTYDLRDRSVHVD
jgi:hypothetical protein